MSHPHPSSYAAALRRFRAESGLGADAIASRVGRSVSLIRHIEAGSKRPGADTAQRLDEVLGAGGALMRVWRETYRPGVVKPAHRPRQLPRQRWLLGVEPAVAALDELAGHEAPMVLTGPAGVGKTALALRWAYQHQRRWPDGVVVLDCHGRSPHSEPRTPEMLLDSVLGHLWPQHHALGAAASLDEKEAALREALHQRRMLLICDDAADDDQIRRLLHTDGATVLVTSRSWLAGLTVTDGALRHHLAPLPTPTAAELLGTLLASTRPVHPGERVDLDRIAGAGCDGLPLALRAATQLILARRGRPLHEVARELTGPHRIRHLHHAVAGDPLASLDHALHASLRAVSESAAALLLHASTGTAPAITAADEPLADELVREHLLDLDATRGWRIPPLVAAWAATQPRPAAMPAAEFAAAGA